MVGMPFTKLCSSLGPQRYSCPPPPAVSLFTVSDTSNQLGSKNIKCEIPEVNNSRMSRLVWLSGLSASLPTEGSPVQLPVRAHAWVVGQVPRSRCARGNQSMYFSHINASLPLFLSPFPSLKINEIFKINKLAANPVRESQQMRYGLRLWLPDAEHR